MMTQPLMITSPDVTPSTGTGSATAGEKGVAEDFLSLLGKALPGQLDLAEGKTPALETALNKAAGNQSAAVDEKTTLAALLSNPDAPQALSALLANVKKTAAEDKTALVDAQNEQTHSLSSADMQALSALFAMLPQQVPTSLPVAVSPVAESDASHGLNALLSASGVKTPGVADTGGKFTAAENTLTLDSAPGTKNTALTNQPLAEDAKAFALNSSEPDRRDAAANNTTTASALTTPAFSTTTLATPATAQIAVPVAPQISAQLGSQEWQQAVSQHITMFTRQGQQSAELRLHPEDLGQIQISMKIDDNQAQLQMVSAHSHVRAALEAALPTLRTALAESGIQLGQSNISGESFAQQQQQQAGQQQQQAQRSAGTFPSLGDGESVAVPASVQRLASGNNAVDIFA